MGDTSYTLGRRLIQAYNLQNVRVLNAQKNPYENKVPGEILKDKELYKSSLGTPVFSDITLGDTINKINNQWTDENGKLQSFEPITFATVLMSVAIPKKIIKTEIAGKNGTVKEYIGLGDYDVNITGIIAGSNGHFPIDQVQNLRIITEAPIPIVVTSWYLQLFNIHTIVIQGTPTFAQEAGGYSYQRFALPAISDLPVELKIL